MGRPRQHKQTARLSVSIEKADYDRVTAIAEANQVSTAWIIRRAVSVFLDDYVPAAQFRGAQEDVRQVIAPVRGARRGQ